MSEDELKRLQEAFKRYSTPAGYMNKAIFARDVFGEGMPQKLAEVSQNSALRLSPSNTGGSTLDAKHGCTMKGTVCLIRPLFKRDYFIFLCLC